MYTISSKKITNYKKIIINKKYPEIFALPLLTISIFIFPVYMRYIFLGEHIGRYNLLACLSIIIIIWKRIRNNLKLKLYFLMIMTMIITQISNPVSIKFFSLSIINLLVPMLLLLTYSEKINSHYTHEKSKLVIEKCMNIFNFCVNILFLSSILDAITNNAIAKILTSLTRDTLMISMAQSEGRFISLYGHPLVSSEIFVIYYVLNLLVSTYLTNEKLKYRYLIISLLGVLSTESKTAIVCILLIVVFANARKPIQLFSGTLAIAIAYVVGLFDSVLLRFTSGSLTTGRWESLVYIQRFDINYFPIFVGNGIYFTYNYLNTLYYNATAAFEFLPLMFFTEYGIVFTLIMYSITFICPLIMIIRKLGLKIGLIIIVVIIEVNVYTGIGNYNDCMYLYVWFIYMVLFIGDTHHEKNV